MKESRSCSKAASCSLAGARREATTSQDMVSLIRWNPVIFQKGGMSLGSSWWVNSPSRVWASFRSSLRIPWGSWSSGFGIVTCGTMWIKYGWSKKRNMWRIYQFSFMISSSLNEAVLVLEDGLVSMVLFTVLFDGCLAHGKVVTSSALKARDS